jgi:hypothetical protein
MADLQQQKQIEAALKLARGKWQKYVIKAGYALLGGSAAFWSGRYTRSLYRLCSRLKEAGIEARAFVNKGDFAFYLVIGAEWAKLVDRVEAVMSPASLVYAEFEGKKFPAETEKVLRELKLRKRLRSFLRKCKDVLSAIGDYYGNSVRGYCDPQEAYNKVIPLVEKIEREWDEMKGVVGIFLL